MPLNKDAYSRYRIIDTELRKGKPLKSKRLADICSDKLGTDIAVRTIQNDIKDMNEDSSLELFANIQYDKSKRAYFYSSDTPMIFPSICLNDEEVNALLFYSKALGHYQNYNIFNNISVAIDKVLENSNIPASLRNIFKNRPIFETEKNINIRGSEHIKTFLSALLECKKIEFDYVKFDGTVSSRILTPQLLKEDKQMWYIIGILEGKDTSSTFALDRINNLKLLEEYYTPIDFDSETYFKYSFGITVPEDNPVKVILSFSPKQAHYLRALKIHETQEVIDDNEKEFKILIMVKPSYEFYAKILSYGSDVKVLSPKEVVEYIKREIQKSFRQY